MSEDVRRQPVEISRYIQSIGQLFEHRIGQIFAELGFRSEISKGQSNGVDIKVYDNNDDLVLVAEVSNWCVYSELSNSRKNEKIRNLSDYSCRKLFIITTLKNENSLNDLQLHGISLLKIGYQLQPKFFYNFFARKNRVLLRRIDSRETKKDIKSKIADSLSAVGIVHLAKMLSTEITVTDFVTQTS